MNDESCCFECCVAPEHCGKLSGTHCCIVMNQTTLQHNLNILTFFLRLLCYHCISTSLHFFFLFKRRYEFRELENVLLVSMTTVNFGSMSNNFLLGTIHLNTCSMQSSESGGQLHSSHSQSGIQTTQKWHD